MKRDLLKPITRTAAALLCLAAAAATGDVTPEERQKALRYLGETSRGVEAAVHGLTEAQWNFKPGPGRWSPAEVLEHLAVLEEYFVSDLSRKLLTAPAGSPERDPRQVDAMILARVPDRSVKAKAPEILEPTGRWTHQDSLARFLAAREKTAAFLKSTPGLRSHVMSHPALGPLDGYQWVLTVAAHSERHTRQIQEAKADPAFPVNQSSLDRRH
jgi:DinB family protein